MRGSKPGERRGGRKAGTPNKRPSQAVFAAHMAQGARACGLTPLDYMLAIMRDETQPLALRVQAAVAAAPYLHRRLKASCVVCAAKTTQPAAPPVPYIVWTGQKADADT